MRDKIAQQAGAIRVILAPTEVMFRIEGAVLFHLAQPLFPIYIVGLCSFIDRDIPFAFGIISAVITLAPDQRANLAARNQFGRLMPASRRATLRTDLENLASFFHRIMHLESLGQVSSEGLLA